MADIINSVEELEALFPEEKATEAAPEGVINSVEELENLFPEDTETKSKAKQFRQTPKGGLFAGEFVKEKELRDLAAHFDVSYDDLKEATYTRGGYLEELQDDKIPLSEKLKQLSAATISRVANAPTLGAINKLRKMAEDPKMERALDELDEMIQEKQSYLMDALDMAVPGLGGVKLAQKLGKAAPLLFPATGAVAGFSGAKKDDEATGAAIGAGLGAALPVAFKGMSKVSPYITKKLFKDTTTSTKVMDEAEDFIEANQKNMKEDFTKAIAGARPDIQEEIVKDLKEGGRVVETFDDALKEFGEKRLLDNYIEIKKQDKIMEGFANSKEMPKDWGGMYTTVSKFADGRPVFSDIDRRFGGATNIAHSIQEISKKLNRNTLEKTIWQEEVNKILPDRLRKDPTAVNDLYQSLRAGKAVGSTTDTQLNKYLEVAEELRKAYNKRHGTELNKREFYVPNKRKSLKSYVLAMTKRSDELSKKYGADLTNLTEDNFTALQARAKEDKAFKEFIDEVERMQGTIADGADFRQKVNKVLSGDYMVSKKLVTDAFFAKKSENVPVPKFVRETNPLAGLDRWTSTMLQADINPELDSIRRAAKLARKQGADNISEHLLRTVEGIIGSEDKSAMSKWVQARAIAAQKSAMRHPNSKVRNVLKDIFPMTEDMVSNTYTSKLSFSPKALLQNLHSPFSSIYPELGTTYGTKIAGEVTTDFASIMKNGFTSKGGRELVERGMVPHKWTGETEQALEDGLRLSLPANLTREAFKVIRDKSFLLFETTEKLARGVALATGKRVAADLSRPGTDSFKLANAFVDQIADVGTRRRLTKAIQRQDKKKLEDELIDYFNTEHMFHYDRPHMSEFGRRYGPLVRMFSKWPTTIAGRALFESRTQKTDLIRKMVAPWAIHQFADSLAHHEGWEESPAFKQIVGREGLSGWTPFGSFSADGIPVIGKALRDVPIGQSMMAVGSMIPAALQTTREGDMEPLVKAADRALFDIIDNYLLPVSGKTFSETLPALSGEEIEKPEYKLELLGRRAGALRSMLNSGYTTLRDTIQSDKEEEEE